MLVSTTELTSSVKPYSNAQVSVTRKMQKNKRMENRKAAREDEVDKQKAEDLEMDPVSATVTQRQGVVTKLKCSLNSVKTIFLGINPLSPSIKLQILLLCFHKFLTEIVGRSC